MKILGLNSVIEIAGQSFSVSSIKKKDITLKGDNTSMVLTRKELEREIFNGNWTVKSV